jgi:hypothetical protein
MGSAKILVGFGGSPRAEQRLDWVSIACKVNGFGIRFVLMRDSRSLDLSTVPITETAVSILQPMKGDLAC